MSKNNSKKCGKILVNKEKIGYDEKVHMNWTILPSESPKHDIDRMREYFANQGYTRIEILGQNFMANSSRKFYDDEWVLRELGQNFLDANRAYPRTINGVEISVSQANAGNKHLSITGNWSFKDPTHLIVMGSEKDNVNDAGGNGAGIKQTAAILLQHNDNCEFHINGEGWKVEYKKVTKADIPELEREPWIIACLKNTTNTGTCSYEVTLPESHSLFTATDRIHDMFVCDENSFLQNPDFVSEKLTIKWPKNKDEIGRLFIAGQVTPYTEEQNRWWEEVKVTARWPGPKGVSMAISDVDAIEKQRTLDRWKKSTEDLFTLITEATRGLSHEEYIQLITGSEHIWAGDQSAIYSWDKEGYMGILVCAVTHLENVEPPFNIMELFPNKKYITCSRNKELNKKLEKQGYIICPCHFAKLQMPKAEDVAGIEGMADVYSPNIREYDLEFHGAYIYHKESNFKNWSQYWSAWRNIWLWKKKRNVYTHEQILSDEHTEIRVKNQDVQNIRDMIGYGLARGWLKSPCFLLTEKKMITFGYDQKSWLIMRVMDREWENTDMPWIYLSTDQSLSEKDLSYEKKKKSLSPLLMTTLTALFLLGSGTVMLQKTEKGRNIWRKIDEIVHAGPAEVTMITTQDKIESLIAECNNYKITPSKSESLLIQRAYQKEQADGIANMKVIENPPEAMKKRLNSMVAYCALITGVEVKVPFFIYQWDGFKWVNMGRKSIWIHEELLKGSFFHAFPTFLHEMAHMYGEWHNADFRAALQSFFSKSIQTYDIILKKQVKNEDLTDMEKLMLRQVNIWEQNEVK